MSRSSYVWKGDLTFGLVNIPILLRSAENRERTLEFDLLDRKTLAPVGYKKVNKITGEEVPKEDLVKGYEYEQGQYVLVSDEDFKRANVERTQKIEILSFVEAKEIPPVYYARPYYLEPAKRSEKGYALFQKALERTGRIGVATLVLHSREHVAAVSAYNSLLLLQLLRYQSELADPVRAKAPAPPWSEVPVSAKELDMAEKLIQGMAERWQPGKFRDEYKDELMAFILKKAKRGEVETVEEAPAPEEPRPAPRDIMALLKQSMERVERSKGHFAERSGARARQGHDGHRTVLH